MLKLTSLTVALAGLIATTATAQSPEEHQAALIAAIEANGCVINGDTAPVILTAAGLVGPEAEAAMNAIGEAGEAADATVKLTRNDDGSVTLTSPNCPAQ